MPFLTLNGYAIPVAAGSFKKGYEEIGQDGERSPAGYLQRLGRRSMKRFWEGETPPLLFPVADQVEQWITGRMFHYGLDDGYASDNGMQPEAGYVGNVGSSSVPKFGGCWLTANGVAVATQSFAYRIPSARKTTEWTCSYWHNQTGLANGWNHYLVSNNGGVLTRYLNGVVTGTVFSNFTVSIPVAGVLRFLFSSAQISGVAATVRYDDIVLANWPMNAAQAAAIAGLGNAFSECPRLFLGGDVEPDGNRVAPFTTSAPPVVRGYVDSDEYTEGAPAGVAYQNNLRVLKFKLVEV